MTNLQIEMALVEVETEIYALSEAMTTCWENCNRNSCYDCELVLALTDVRMERLDLQMERLVNNALEVA